MWPALLHSMALRLGYAHPLGTTSIHPRLFVGPCPAHHSVFAPPSHPVLPRSSQMRPDGFGAHRSEWATMCAQPADSPRQKVAVSPREITSYLTNADSLPAILDVYKRHGSSFDAINVATA
ncbi:hypothetical protein T492DRAFT_987435 [Pavlovales sp. CCMP2436]|nr:hypothetical protein T492DRAFT_987435 [Pavlovales sp. CCMP2436]